MIIDLCAIAEAPKAKLHQKHVEFKIRLKQGNFYHEKYVWFTIGGCDM